ncbi:MAG: starch-binding protein, partial [Muribaculaceae bacterium]|nr:starch-binding protein [Muribaculaceae bacterium]
MKKKLLTKTFALMLLAVFATAWSTQAWAGIKIYVRTEGNAANNAPYLYVWDENGEELNGTWSESQMAETTTTADGLTWYVKEFNKTNINAIIHNNLGGNNNQTITLSGISEDRYYSYKGGSEYYNLTNQYVIPENATYQEGNFVYFVNTSEWGTPCIWVYDNDNVNYNTNSSWPGDQLTKVENSVNLWVWKGTKSGNPTKIIFSNNGGDETAALDYTNGGYYHTGALITTITQMLLNSTNFPDPNFRAALAERLNVNEGDEIYPNNVTVLDVSNKGISNLTGIENFTNLEELYAQNNSITSTSSSSNINVASNNKLKILNASNNSSLTHVAGIANCHVLEELYLDGIDFWPARQISTSTAANKLSGTNNPALRKLSLSGSELQSAFTISGFSNLKYLNISNNPNFNGLTLNAPALEYLNLAN